MVNAAINRDDTLHENANINIERGRWPSGSTTKSDSEDDDKRNTVKYTNSKACDSEFESGDSDE